MLEIPCAACRRRALNPETDRWARLLAEVDFGHDQIAHPGACCANGNRSIDDDGEPITGCDCICHINEDEEA